MAGRGREGLGGETWRSGLLWCPLVPLVPVMFWIELDYELVADTASF